MNEEEKALLEESIKLSRENNKILRGMRRDARIERFWHFLKWIVIIVATIWSYYLIQPYLEQLQGAYQNIQDAKNAVSDIQGKVQVDTSQIQNFFNNLKNN
ncbi:hypothetical protein H6775_03355 [Candidatus Nomurabacteria bacterium]|nr:hypothetical protein [Candidatus Nomurabacteria bacterium]